MKNPKASRKRVVKPVPPTPQQIVDAFVTAAAEVTNDVLIGIDPGNTGAIAFRCAKFYCEIDIPQVATKVKRSRKTTFQQRQATGMKSRTVLSTLTEPDLGAICAVFRAFKPVRSRVTVVLEKIPISIGAGRKYADILINRAYAMWPLFLYSQGLPVLEVRPGVWKAEMGLLHCDKEDSRKLALRLFPLADIKRKKDHNRADAILLTEYLRREMAGELRKSK